MRRFIRKASMNKLMIVIPKALCEHLDYYRGMPISILIKKQDLILSKENKQEENKSYDFVLERKIIQMGGSKSLAFAIPKKIELILNYKPDQEIEIQLKGQQLHIYKLYGE
jgi:antitoxin component of MazEF toxin-antitoxin module